MAGPQQLVIVGDSAFAEIACEYFTHDSSYQVAAFAVEKAFLKRTSLLGLPVVAFEDLVANFPPDRFDVFVAITYGRLNRLRRRLYEEAKAKGYRLATYVSSRAFVWRNVTMGDNCFVFEGNVLQPFVRLGSNVILWSGNHIGHHSTIGDHTFVASHVVVSGFVDVGQHCFIGVNATIANNLRIMDDTLVGAGALLTRDTVQGGVYAPSPSQARDKDAFTQMGVPEAER